MVDDRVDEAVDGALRALYADVPAMDDEAFAAGRTRVLAAIEAAPPPDVVVDRLTPTPARTSRRSRAAPLLTAAAAVVVVAVGAVVLLPGDAAPTGPTVASQPPPHGVPVPPAPPGPLPPMPAAPHNAAGDLAAKVRDPAVPADQYRYWKESRTQAASASDPGWQDAIEVWIPADRGHPWLFRTPTGDLRNITAGAFEQQLGACRRDGRGVTCPDGGPWAATRENVAGMSRDPAVLYEKLRATVNAGPPAGTSVAITPTQDAVNKLLALISDAVTVPADLRAALLRTLGYLPGVTIGEARTTDARAATMVSWDLDNGNYRNELLLDPATMRTLEWRNTALRAFNGYRPGQTFTSIVQTEALVPAMGKTPR